MVSRRRDGAMTNDPTKPPNKWRGEQSSTGNPDDYVPWIIRDDPAHWPMNEGQGDTLNPDLHSQLVDLRHEIAELRELLRSANCKARFMLAFSIFNLAALGVAVLMWVLR